MSGYREAIIAAVNGEMRALLRLLDQQHPLELDDYRILRSYLAGELSPNKRRRGRPAKTADLWQSTVALAIRDYREEAQRRGRKAMYRNKDRLVAEIATKHRVDPDVLSNQLYRDVRIK